MSERLFCLVLAYATGLCSYHAFAVWENPWFGTFLAIAAVCWLLQPYDHRRSRAVRRDV